MTNHEHGKITIDRREETRSREISSMINEGGLGADKNYTILKEMDAPEQKNNRNTENR